MSKYYTNVLRNIFLSLLIFFIAILYVVYSTFESYAVEENSAKVQDLLMHNKALHTYVETTLKPIIYNFQTDGNLSLDYFNPKILSFTYISRHIMQEYNKQRIINKLPPVKYRIASNNPRNSINLANYKESLLLDKFNRGEISKYTKEIINEHDRSIYYAMPIAKRCHSQPQAAPADMIKMYGDKNGFNEKIGDIRAFIAITMPLDGQITQMQKLYLIIALAIGAIFVVGLITVYIFIKKLDAKEHNLEEQVNLDGLTKIYNRYKFNKDLEVFVHSQRRESVHMIMFDIDHFKHINDTYGHPVGDVVLQTLSEYVQNAIRPEDRFYRVGGEEFVILSLMNNEETQKQFASRVHKIVGSIEFEKFGTISISVGYTKLIKGDTPISFYERCDKALYTAKESGRNCIRAL